MGLDVTYMQNAEFVGKFDEIDEEAAWEQGLHLCWPNKDFPKHAESLVEGYYKGAGVSTFRAGSYSGYNRWRELLSETVHGMTPHEIWTAADGAYEGYAFIELIHFSDCEGIIGPLTSASLAQDFNDFSSKIKEWGSYDITLYQNFMRAFNVAAINGIVQFH